MALGLTNIYIVFFSRSFLFLDQCQSKCRSIDIDICNAVTDGMYPFNA